MGSGPFHASDRHTRYTVKDSLTFIYMDQNRTENHKTDWSAPRLWSSWNSPIGLGFFLFTASLALAILLYVILNLIGTMMTLSQASEASRAAAEYQTQYVDDSALMGE